MKYIMMLMFSLLSIQSFPQVFERLPNYFPERNNIPNRSIITSREELYLLTTNSFLNINKTLLNESYQIDSIYNHVLSGTNSKLKFGYKNGKVSSILFSFFDEDKWQPREFKTLHHNQFGFLDTVLTLVNLSSESVSWINEMQMTLKYDSLGNRTDIFIESFNDGKWTGFVHDELHYNKNKKLVLFKVFSWQGDRWVFYSQDSVTYNLEGERISNTLQLFVNGGLINKRQIVFINDLLGRDSVYIYKDWINDEWSNYAMEINTYDSWGNMVECLGKVWDGNRWYPDYRYSYQYNSNNCYVYGMCEEWNNERWIQAEGGFELVFDLGYGIYSTASKQYTYYSNPAGIKDKNTIITDFKLFQNYPNPFNPITIINYLIPSDGIIELKIFNILGQEIITLINEYKTKGKYELKFDASNLTSGVYFYRLRSGAYIETKKMIIQK